jgi:N-acyl-L-homoserine lactone synthetase
MPELKDIAFREEDYVVRTLHGPELDQSYRLRHRVFAETLRWVLPSSDGKEIDLYDVWGTTIGLVRADGMVVGMARLLPSSGPFMLEHDLAALLPPGHRVRKTSDTAEITRLAVTPEIRDKGLSARIMLAVLKGVYQWAVENNVRYYYLEVEHRFLRVLRALGFPCEPLGAPVSLPPAGASSVAAVYDMMQFDEQNARRRPEFLQWMSTIQTMDGVVVTGRQALACTNQELVQAGAAGG